MKNYNVFWGILSIFAVFLLVSFGVGYGLPYVIEYAAMWGWVISDDLSMLINYVLVFSLTISWAIFAGLTIFEFEIPNLKPEIRRLNPNLIVVGVILIFAANIVLEPVQRFLPDYGTEMLDDYMKSGLWSMISAVVVAPVLEEYLFRGVIQRNIELKVGAIWSIVISSVIFGAIHVIVPQVVAATAAGLVLGSVYYITRSLNSVIAIHVVNNGLAYLFWWILGDNQNVETLVVGDGMLYYVVYGVSLVLIILGGLSLWRVVSRRRGLAAVKYDEDI